MGRLKTAFSRLFCSLSCDQKESANYSSDALQIGTSERRHRSSFLFLFSLANTIWVEFYLLGLQQQQLHHIVIGILAVKGMGHLLCWHGWGQTCTCSNAGCYLSQRLSASWLQNGNLCIVLETTVEAFPLGRFLIINPVLPSVAQVCCVARGAIPKLFLLLSLQVQRVT